MRKTFLSAICLALLTAGCDGPNQPRTAERVGQDNLIQVGELCRHYQFTKQKPPQQLGDLGLVRSMGGVGYEALRTGSIVLRYNATLPDMDEDPGHAESNEVLAYEKQVPESGGYVLMLNRTIKKMTAVEFKASALPAGAKEGSPEPAVKK
jgi:hypothetical protein